MFKFSFNSTTLRQMDLLVALKHIIAAGYDGVELMLNDRHLNPLTTSRQRIAELRDFCRSENITISAIAAGGDKLLGDQPYYPTLFDSDSTGRAKRLNLLGRCIELADYLDVPVLDFNSGPKNPGLSPEQSWEHLATGIHWLLSCGGKVTLAIEPEPDFLIGTTADGIRLVQQINHPNFQLNTDVGHVNVSEDDCYNAIERAIPFTRNMHIEDIRNRVHRHEIPGQGDINFDRVFDVLNKTGYSHYIAVELHHHNDRWQRALDESIAYLNRYRTVHA